ncbi:MAG: hypothetical protein ACD_71C00114G0005 [uncultured bacterium (gcode 4)]|uniref:Uncharacterized protein n=1 Tax=uncultured bacterium (gcode 4) TaxID=1234023 RepID=K1Z4P5_9BACT|nr:MAG: hypothetical protein ACD_71C00114G0005 [uncultured bacterium (gcode 4)]
MGETYDPIIEDSNTQIAKVEKECAVFLSRFNDPDVFLDNANIAVQYHFWKQSEYTDISEFKTHLKEILKWYVQYFSLSSKEGRKFSSKASEIEETYDKIIFFGVNNPVESRRERVETWKTVEEQWKEAKGLVVKFTGAVKKIF